MRGYSILNCSELKLILPSGNIRWKTSTWLNLGDRQPWMSIYERRQHSTKEYKNTSVKSFWPVTNQLEMHCYQEEKPTQYFLNTYIHDFLSTTHKLSLVLWYTVWLGTTRHFFFLYPFRADHLFCKKKKKKCILLWKPKRSAFQSLRTYIKQISPGSKWEDERYNTEQLVLQMLFSHYCYYRWQQQ